MRRALGQLARRLRAQVGETLVETLAAIMVSALAITMLSTGIATAARLNADAHKDEASVRASLLAADRADAGEGDSMDDATVTVTGYNDKTHTYDVVVYGDVGEGTASEVVSYGLKGEG